MMRSIVLVLFVAAPIFADGSDWLVAKSQPVKSPPIESDWTLDEDGSYVRTFRRATPPKAASTTPQTRSQSVPAVTPYPFGQVTTPATTVATGAATNPRKARARGLSAGGYLTVGTNIGVRNAAIGSSISGCATG